MDQQLLQAFLPFHHQCGECRGRLPKKEGRDFFSICIPLLALNAGRVAAAQAWLRQPNTHRPVAACKYRAELDPLIPKK